LLALGMALSVIAGDARALVGSVGLAGLALPWALPAPIEPQVFIAPATAWTNVYVRYMVNARERRKWASDLLLAISQEMAKT
jgi:hypothetical protein